MEKKISGEFQSLKGFALMTLKDSSDNKAVFSLSKLHHDECGNKSGSK